MFVTVRFPLRRRRLTAALTTLALVAGFGMAGASPALAGSDTSSAATGLATVSGTVQTNAVVPAAVPGAEVTLAKADSAVEVAWAVADDLGNYSIPNVYPGTYVVRFEGPENSGGYFSQWWDGSIDGDVAKRLVVTWNQTITGINALLDTQLTLASISGSISLGGAPDTAARTSVDVDLIRTDGLHLHAATDAAGNYTLPGVFSGRYAVSFTTTSRDHQPMWWKDAATEAQSTPLVVAPSASLTVSAVLPHLAPFSSAPAPTITGTAAVGATLTAVTPVWSPDSAGWEYTWMRNGKTIIGADGNTFVVREVDLGGTITVRARGQVGSDTAQSVTSLPTGKVLRFVGPAPKPTITGDPVVGQKLTAKAGTWGPASVALTYQWKRGGVVVPGATAATYVVTKADMGKAIAVRITGRAPGFAPKAVTSYETYPAVARFTTTGKPTITGTPAVGATLAAKTGMWSPAPSRYGYQWFRDGTPIYSATKSTYLLTSADQKSRITVTVSAAKTQYEAASATSAATAVVAKGTLRAPSPTIIGIATVGRTFKVIPGTWTPAPVRITYQWKRNGVAIAGAYKSTYTIVAKDRGKSITVTAKGTKPGYTTLVRTSTAKRPS